AVVSAISLVVLVASGFAAWSSLEMLSAVPVGKEPETSAPVPAVSISDTLPPVRVAVLNGCGRPGIASVFVQKLRKDGMDVVNGLGGNADSFEFDRSVVVDRRGNRENAEAVAGSLGIRHILDQRSESPYLMEDVVVVIGRDWDTLLFPRKEMSD
ncbi:MAG: LytR C-terminal domain-containing protein, partial [Candidatus Latescibacterota bacterium]